jgi:hypothetical protein
LYVDQVRRCLSGRPSPEQFALLINEFRHAGGTEEKALVIARQYGFGPDDVAECFAAPPKYFTADQKAAILGITYARRTALHLTTIGSIDVDKAGREQLRREKRNAYKRAKRAADDSRIAEILQQLERGETVYLDENLFLRMCRLRNRR